MLSHIVKVIHMPYLTFTPPCICADEVLGGGGWATYTRTDWVSFMLIGRGHDDGVTVGFILGMMMMMWMWQWASCWLGMGMMMITWVYHVMIMLWSHKTLLEGPLYHKQQNHLHILYCHRVLGLHVFAFSTHHKSLLITRSITIDCKLHDYKLNCCYRDMYGAAISTSI